MARRKAQALAKKIDCELDVDTRHRTVTIHLPDGFQIPGNPGLNIRVNNMEKMADAWEATLDDLRDLEQFGMEPLS